jgi:hypothetical protein
MSHPANSIAPRPGHLLLHAKNAEAFALLCQVVKDASTPPPSSGGAGSAGWGGGGGGDAPPDPTPWDLGTAFSQPYPQLLPQCPAAHAEDARIAASYAPFFAHLPFIGYTDVKLDFTSATGSPYWGLVWSGRIAVAAAAAAPGDAAQPPALHLVAVQALTGVSHFCLDSQEEDFIPVSLFLPAQPSPLPLTPASLHALAAALRSAFISPHDCPPQLHTAFSGCPHCPGCNTFARAARLHGNERALSLAAAAAFAAAPPPDLLPPALPLAHAIIACPVLPTLCPGSTGPQNAAWPAGEFAALQGLLDPELLAALQGAPLPSASAGSAAAAAAAALLGLMREEVPGWIYSFPLFTPLACAALLGVTEAHEGFCAAKGIPVQRPNSMNRYGVILRSIGLGAFVNSLTAAVLQPIMGALFPLEGLQGGGCSSQHGFIVAYDAQEGKDRLLDMHTDDAECVRLPVCVPVVRWLGTFHTPPPSIFPSAHTHTHTHHHAHTLAPAA